MSDLQEKVVTIYTDGSCLGNPGPGGWAAVMQYGSEIKEVSGYASAATTNNRMELTAAIRALESLKRPCVVCLYTDSIYLRDGIERWLPEWKRKNWKRSKNKPVLNVDLWKQLDQLNQKHRVTWRWVAGHSGNEWNDRADQLAREAIPTTVTEAG